MLFSSVLTVRNHDVLKFQFLFALHTAYEIGGGGCKRFCIGNEYGTRLFAMDGIEIILMPARKEALHRAPDLRRIAAVAIENEPAVHVCVDPLCRHLLRLPCRAARNDCLPAIIK